MTQLQPVLPTQLSDKEIQIIESLSVNTCDIIATPYRLPEGVKSIAVQKDLHHARIAYKRLDGFFEFKFLQLPRQHYNFYEVVHHKIEAPTDRQGIELLELIGWVEPKKAFDQVWEQVKSNRTQFVIPDSGKMSTPFEELHFWSWLTENEPEGKHNKITTRNRYLNELGYNLHKHTLSTEDIKILSYTIDQHWDTFFKPAKAVI